LTRQRLPGAQRARRDSRRLRARVAFLTGTPPRRHAAPIAVAHEREPTGLDAAAEIWRLFSARARADDHPPDRGARTPSRTLLATRRAGRAHRTRARGPPLTADGLFNTEIAEHLVGSEGQRQDPRQPDPLQARPQPPRPSRRARLRTRAPSPPVNPGRQPGAEHRPRAPQPADRRPIGVIPLIARHGGAHATAGAPASPAKASAPTAPPQTPAGDEPRASRRAVSRRSLGQTEAVARAHSSDAVLSRLERVCRLQPTAVLLRWDSALSVTSTPLTSPESCGQAPGRPPIAVLDRLFDGEAVEGRERAARSGARVAATGNDEHRKEPR
jgi:hypothetical protein